MLVVFVCRAVGHTVGLFIVRRLVNLSLRQYTYKVVVPILIVIVLSIGISMPIHFLLTEGLVRFICVAILSVTTVAISLYYIAFDENERQLALQLVNRLLSMIKLKKQNNV